MTAERDFEIFKREFTKYQRLFGLSGWKVRFKHGASDEYFASIESDFGQCVATVFLNTDLPAKDRDFRDVRGNAKHEAIHLLLARLEGEARARYTNPSAVTESLEATVHRLEGLIP